MKLHFTLSNVSSSKASSPYVAPKAQIVIKDQHPSVALLKLFRSSLLKLQMPVAL